MREIQHNADAYKGVIRRRLLRAATSAIGTLERAARGCDEFENDAQLRACIALARLSPGIVGTMEEQRSIFESAEWWTPKKVRLLEILDSDFDPRHWEEMWLKCFNLNGPLEECYETEEEAIAYGRERWEARMASRSGEPGTESEAEWHNRVMNEAK